MIKIEQKFKHNKSHLYDCDLPSGDILTKCGLLFHPDDIEQTSNDEMPTCKKCLAKVKK